MANLESPENKYIISMKFEVLFNQLVEHNSVHNIQVINFRQMIENCGDTHDQSYQQLSNDIKEYFTHGRESDKIRIKNSIDTQLALLVSKSKFCDLVNRVYKETR
jgi:hypothetical protein